MNLDNQLKEKEIIQTPEYKNKTVESEILSLKQQKEYLELEIQQ